MRPRLAIPLLAFIVCAAAPLTGQLKPGIRPPLGPPQGWPQKHPVPEVPAEEKTTALPVATIRQGFEVGVALHDPARVGDAVVSALALLGIDVDAGQTSEVSMGGRRASLSEREVLALIAMGKADAKAQAEDSSGPFTFTQLHRALGHALEVTVEDLSAMFADHYEQNPDSIVGQILMGQPLEPDTPLLRTELWFLFADAVWPMSGAQAARRRPGFVLASLQVLPGPAFQGWISGQIRSSRSGLHWASSILEELEARLPLIAAGSISLTTNGGKGHKGHGGPGTPFPVQARIDLPTIRFQRGPAPALVPTQNSLGGVPVTWAVDDVISRHASASPLSRVTVPASGVAQVTITPKRETPSSQGGIVSEAGLVTIRADLGNLVEKAYGFYAPDLFGQTVTAETGALIEWHNPDTIEFMLTNQYDVGSNVAAFGLTRTGVDSSHGTLARGEDGIYRGSASLVAVGAIGLPGQSCGAYGFGWQFADVVAVPIPETSTSPPPRTTGVVGPGGGQGAYSVPAPSPGQVTPFYNAVHRPGDYKWIRGGPPKEYFRLEFYPRTAPHYSPKDDCQEEIPGSRSRPTFNFVPLNDAQWTIEGMYEGRGGSDQANRTGYAIAVPESGEMAYEDRTSENQSMKVGKVDLATLVKAKSIWYVTITRTVEK
jgi:hypothetical protein